jgi:hypothetical protein
MRLEQTLADFLASPVMIIIGSHDADCRPEIGRGNGAIVDARSDSVDLLFSRWLWPGTAHNIATNGAIAVTFARPRDYAAFQLKGNATLVTPTARHLRVSADYGVQIRQALAALGLVPQLMEPWLTDRDPLVARIAVAEVFEQTPGPRAGRAVQARP